MAKTKITSTANYATMDTGSCYAVIAQKEDLQLACYADVFDTSMTLRFAVLVPSREVKCDHFVPRSNPMPADVFSGADKEKKYATVAYRSSKVTLTLPGFRQGEDQLKKLADWMTALVESAGYSMLPVEWGRFFGAFGDYGDPNTWKLPTPDYVFEEGTKSTYTPYKGAAAKSAATETVVGVDEDDMDLDEEEGNC